ncbi:MAG: hypothetical protein ACYDIA_06345 [Candidatus Humimicrobiaceae bacterium]
MASHILGRVARRIRDDWTTKYDHPIYMLETSMNVWQIFGYLLQGFKLDLCWKD